MINRTALTIVGGLSITALIGLAPDPVAAQGYFEGKTITLVVPNSPSGRMSQYAQMMAPFIELHTGADDVRLEYMQGAGGLLGANHVWFAEPDGTVITFTSIPTLILAELAGSEGVQFEATDFTYLGRAATEGRVLVTGTVSGINSIADAQAKDGDFIYPSQGTDEDFYTMAILADAFGLDLRMVTGFEGNADTQLSVIKGEGHGHLTAWSSALGPINGGDMKPLLTVSEERNPDFPDVPTALELVPEDKVPAVAGIVNMLAMHRGFFGPPNMDPEAAAALRDGIAAALADPDLIAESERTGLFLLPSHGDVEQERIQTIVDASESLRPILQSVLESIR